MSAVEGCLVGFHCNAVTCVLIVIFMQALRRQFPVTEGYREISRTEFRFTSQPPNEKEIQIKFERRDSGEWILALQSADKVCVTHCKFKLLCAF